MKCSAKNYEAAINPLRIINLLTGLRTFEYPRGRFRPMITISLVVLTLMIGLYTTHLQMKDKYVKKMSKTEIVLYSLLPYISLVLSFILIVVGCYQTQRFNEYVKRLRKVDKTLEALDSSTVDHKFYNKSYILLIAFCVYVIFLYGVSYTHRSMSDTWINALCRSLTYVYVMSLGPILAMDFSISMRHVQSRFRKINEMLRSTASFPDAKKKAYTDDRKYLKDRTFKWSGKLIHSGLERVPTKTTKLDPQGNERTLQTIRQIHLELSKLLRTLSEIFGIQISVEMSISMFFITIGCYICYYIVIKPEEVAVNMWYIISMFLLFVVHVLKILLINYACDSAVCEANNTGEILHTFYGSDPNRNIREEMRQFELQMMQCRYLNSASGIFIFSCKLICGCLGTVTTYVVIIIQMS